MDATDHALIRALREDSRATNAALGRRVGLTESAVRRRIERLRRDGIIVRFTLATVPLGPEGLVLLRCRPGRTEAILAKLQAIARETFETSGEYDLAASLDRGTMEELNQELDRIRSWEGVESTLTLIPLSRGRSVSRGRAPEGRARARPARAGRAPRATSRSAR